MMDSVLVFLCLPDLNEGTVTDEHVLFSIFATRIDVFDQLEFRGAYMRLCMAVIRVHMSYKAPLGPLERVFLACAYVSRPTTRLNWRDLSLVTHFALRIQSVYNKYAGTCIARSTPMNAASTSASMSSCSRSP